MESPALLGYVEKEVISGVVVDSEYLSGFCFQLLYVMVSFKVYEKQLFSTPSL